MEELLRQMDECQTKMDKCLSESRLAIVGMLHTVLGNKEAAEAVLEELHEI